MGKQFDRRKRWKAAAVSVAAVVTLSACGGGGALGLGEAPMATGEAKFAFSAGGADIDYQVQANGFAIERLSKLWVGDSSSGLVGLKELLAADLAKRSAAMPGTEFGLVPNRLPTLHFREGRHSSPGYAMDDSDPITGLPRMVDLRYGDNFQVVNGDPMNPGSQAPLMNRLHAAALDHDVIAPMWEVRTASILSARGTLHAGLTEVMRAAREDKLAPLLNGSNSTRSPGTFTMVGIDLDGDGGVTQVSAQGSQRYVDWDGSGFLKRVGWVGAGDGVLFLDRNGDGLLDSPRELLSNPLLVDAAKGLASLAWLDADGDGRLTSADPVFEALRVWHDRNADGQKSSDELATLAALNISELDISGQQMARGGHRFPVQTVRLEAGTVGFKVKYAPATDVFTARWEITCSGGGGLSFSELPPSGTSSGIGATYCKLP